MPRSSTRGFNLYLRGLLCVWPGCAAGLPGLIKQAGGLFVCEQQLEQSSPTAALDANSAARTCSSGSSSAHEEMADPLFQPCLFATQVSKKLERHSTRGGATAHVRP